MDVQDDEALDLLHGLKEIAEYLVQSESKTGYQIRKGYWDGAVFRIGKTVHASRSRLRARASGQVSK